MCKIGCARAGKSSLSSVLSNFRMFVIWGSFWVISGVGCVKAGKSLLLSVLCTVCSTGLFTHCNTLQHTATHWNTLQHTAIHCNALQYTATHCNTLQHTAIHCNTLQYTATHCDTLQHTKSLQYGAFLYRYRVLLVLIYHVHVFQVFEYKYFNTPHISRWVCDSRQVIVVISAVQRLHMRALFAQSKGLFFSICNMAITLLFDPRVIKLM